MKSVKLYWNDRNVAKGDVLALLFGDRRDTIATARLLIDKMKASHNLSFTKRQMRFFAKDLESGKFGVKYSYHNFYVKMLRKLLDMGFVEKDVLIWDEKKRKTEAVYQLKLQAIPARPPQAGFFRQCWEIARGWNEVIKN